MKVLQRRVAALRSKTIPLLSKPLKTQIINRKTTVAKQVNQIGKNSQTSQKGSSENLNKTEKERATNTISNEVIEKATKRRESDEKAKENKKPTVTGEKVAGKRGRKPKNQVSDNTPKNDLSASTEKQVSAGNEPEAVKKLVESVVKKRRGRPKLNKLINQKKKIVPPPTHKSKPRKVKTKEDLTEKKIIKKKKEIESPKSQEPMKIDFDRVEKNNNAIDFKSTESDQNSSIKRSPRRYQCGVCDKIFLGSNDLRKHLRIHSDERPYACPHCDKKFRQGGCLKNHIASQHGTDTVYTCDYCLKTFPIKERLRLHIRVHTGEKPYRCEYCPKTFARGGQLTQHLVTHTGEKKFKCEYCSQKFSSAANLRLHQKTHLDERDFTCHLCGKGFYRPDALKKHISCYHHNIKAFHCKICNKMFKGHLPQHKRTHKHIKKHGCSTCGATFSQRSQLVVHQRIHSGERPYRCQVCWQAFAHSSVLKLHIRKHTGEKPFKCPLCIHTGLGFSQLPHLKKHLKSIHGQDKPYMCDNCKEFFKTKLEIQQHTLECIKQEVVTSVEELIEREIRINQTSVEPPMPLARMRLMVAILLKKISTEDRLRQLGYEKRLIDNVLIDSLKCAGRPVCESREISEAQRLKANVQEFLDWTVPVQYMENFRQQHRSTEEILEELTN